MGGDLELRPLADPLDRPLQVGIGKGHQTPAADADHVVVMTARVIPLESHNLAADIDPMNQFQLLELLERPVNAGPPDTRQPPIDLQRRNRAALTAKQLNHLQPRRPSPKTSLIKARPSAIHPAHAEHPT